MINAPNRSRHTKYRGELAVSKAPRISGMQQATGLTMVSRPLAVSASLARVVGVFDRSGRAVAGRARFGCAGSLLAPMDLTWT